MRERSWRVVLPMLLVLALSCARVEGQSPRMEKEAGIAAAPASTATSTNPDVDAKALRIFDRMAQYLSTSPKLSVTIESGYDAVQASGLKVEFGETRKISVRRPDHFRMDTTTRDGNERG